MLIIKIQNDGTGTPEAEMSEFWTEKNVMDNAILDLQDDVQGKLLQPDFIKQLRNALQEDTQ